jgi:hypothetical protein
MKLRCSWQVRLAQGLLGAALVIGLVVVSGTNAQNDPVHTTTDWSHRHLIFSTPKTLFDRIQFSSNHRYVQQWVRRYAEKAESEEDREAWRWRRAERESMKGDWSMNMGAGARVGQGMYPAKFSFDASTANCGNVVAPKQPDFVVYNTSLLGNNTLVAATAFGTFSAVVGSAAGSTIVFTNPTLGTVLSMSPGVSNANTGTNTGTYVVPAPFIAGSVNTEATNLSVAINLAGNGSHVGITSPGTAGGRVNFTATTAGLAGNNITIANSAAPASRFNPANINFAGGSNGQASVVAFDNLYSGCAPPALATPTVYWAYNTGGTVVTSPTLSYDGSQVAFVQTLGGVGTLTLIKWKASATDNYNNPTNLTAANNVTNANYRACTAPCMTTILFDANGHARTDTNSAVFYDFPSDTMFVGGNGGTLRKFTGVFLGTPAENCAAGCGVVQVGWPVFLGVANITTSPVYDHATGQTFIGDSGGFLYSVTNPVAPALPVVVRSARLGFSLGIVDSPIVDSVAGKVYVFVSNDAGGVVTANNSRVFQFAANFAGASSGASVTVGDSSGVVRAFAGDFDNAYYSSAGGIAGNLYVCGSVTGAVNYIPTLWQISITGTGAMAVTATQGPTLATTNGTSCGPVVESYNSTAPAKDWIFTSVVANAVTAPPITCPAVAGCIMSFDVTLGTPISAATSTTGHTRVSGGASGVVVDNTVGAGTLAGASQVYFTPLNNQACATSGGNGGCAIQASQSSLM